MPIGINTNFARMSARALAEPRTEPAPPFAPAPAPPPSAAAPPPPAAPPAAPAPSGLFASAAGKFMPGAFSAATLAGIPFRPFPTLPPVAPGPSAPQPPKTATQLARGAMAQLAAAPPSAVVEAINAIRSAGVVDGPGIMTHLERKTPVRTVLESFARDWSESTLTDFADQAFRMARDHFDAMDSIVSLAILNDSDLEEEIIFENTSQTTSGDLMDNREVVWQFPEAGTLLQPPYVILVAVEYRDVATAQDVFRSIAGELGVRDGFKMPKSVIQRLG